ncbi:hypothetical protein LPJ75_001900, partial [Coemansia sp. RSA 2598]
MSDAYDYGVATGPLKLKKPKGLFKKTASKDKKKSKHRHKHKHKHKRGPGEKKQQKDSAEKDKSNGDDDDDDGIRDGQGSPMEPQTEPPTESLTEAEKKYREALHQRRLERIDRLASKSHRDRVKEFNEKLERAPEHHDMPK